MSNRQLPSDIDAERATLGSILMNREAIIPIAPWLQAAAFYLEKHAWIYEAMLACYNARTPPDLRTVADELRRNGRLDAIGGIAYLADLVDSVPTSYHVESYAKIVERTALLRRLIAAGGKIAALGFNEQADLETTIADAQALLTEATARQNETDLVPFEAIAHKVYTAYTAEDGGDNEPVATGFRDLDELLSGGVHRQDLSILAARPGLGKSTLAGNIAANVAERGLPVLVFSLEMGDESWFQRHVASRAGINLSAIRSRELRDVDLPRFINEIGTAANLPIYVDESGVQTPASIRNKVLRWTAQHGAPGLIVIDYLQLMESKRKDGNRVLEIAEISRSLKQLAREVNAPVLALSQLSRAVEGRSSHVPMLSDLRESGSLEQDADIVMFIYREELYDKETDKKGIAEIHIAKHRNGPVGVVPMRFEASTTRFMDLSYRAFEGY